MFDKLVRKSYTCSSNDIVLKGDRDTWQRSFSICARQKSAWASALGRSSISFSAASCAGSRSGSHGDLRRARSRHTLSGSGRSKAGQRRVLPSPCLLPGIELSSKQKHSQTEKAYHNARSKVLIL